MKNVKVSEIASRISKCCNNRVMCKQGSEQCWAKKEKDKQKVSLVYYKRWLSNKLAVQQPCRLKLLEVGARHVFLWRGFSWLGVPGGISIVCGFVCLYSQFFRKKIRTCHILGGHPGATLGE